MDSLGKHFQLQGIHMYTWNMRIVMCIEEQEGSGGSSLGGGPHTA